MLRGFGNCIWKISLAFVALAAAQAQELPANRWVEVTRDPEGARRGSAVRYSSAAGEFFLWGFMNADAGLLQEQPLMRAPEYDVVAFDPATRRWRNQLPREMEREWSRRLPLAYVPRTYSGITTGSERTVLRGTSDENGAVPRPDLNIVFDQVAYRPANNSLYYFTGGLTAAYDITHRRWRDLNPAHSPPPVLGGSLAYDPDRDEVVLFGGGHVAESGPGGTVRGYTGTWIYSVADNDWRQLPASVQPPPRIAARMVYDSRNRVLVLFGGDGQRYYLADTWIFDLRKRVWRESAAARPPPRAGHFTVYDPETGLVIIGGGYNRADLTDMWAYDAASDRWRRAAGQVPTAFSISADLAPDKRIIVLTADSRAPGDRTRCNVLFPVRTTYCYRIEKDGFLGEAAAERHVPMPKRPSEELAPDVRAAKNQEAFLAGLPENQWVPLPPPARAAPTRTWGSATIDARGRVLYWGGGHCGYEGSDVDEYDVAANTWIPEGRPPSYPERLWNHGVRLAGVTFDGEPWTDHGRRIYAYDPPGDRLVMVRPIRLTSGYEPEWLKAYPSKKNTAPDALVTEPSSYGEYVTWVYDLRTRRWAVLGPAPAGLDTLASTPLGVMGVPVNWPGRLNDAGYQLPWRASQPPEDNAVFQLRGARWERIDRDGPSPQNLYEMTSLAFDTRRGRLILHGGGARRDELWTFEVKTGRWENRRPSGTAPACQREAVYLPDEDVFLTFGAGTWAYSPASNTWSKLDIPDPPARVGQNRAMAYDARRNLVLLVLGEGEDAGRASVYAMRLRLAKDRAANARDGVSTSLRSWLTAVPCGAGALALRALWARSPGRLAGCRTRASGAVQGDRPTKPLTAR